MEAIGYIAALVIGITLGLMGGGGSILSIPVLVYLFGINPSVATADSLFIVGITALVGAYRNYKQDNVELKKGITFLIPSMLTVFLTRKFMMPNLPDSFLNYGEFELTKEIAIMLFFAIIMALAAISMLKSSPMSKTSNDKNIFITVLSGLAVGLITGIVGAGGGFLIIPALVLANGLDMKKAVGTSLMIIAINTLFGFTSELSSERAIDWFFLLSFASLAIIGMLFGNYIAKFIPSGKLKKAFGIFILLMGVFIFLKELKVINF